MLDRSTAPSVAPVSIMVSLTRRAGAAGEIDNRD
jgi:hypothetical protein